MWRQIRAPIPVWDQDQIGSGQAQVCPQLKHWVDPEDLVPRGGIVHFETERFHSRSIKVESVLPNLPSGPGSGRPPVKLWS